MRVTPFVRRRLAVLREARDMARCGYEELGEGGGRIWELYRGGRTDHRIIDAIISVSGKFVWVKCEKDKRT